DYIEPIATDLEYNALLCEIYREQSLVKELMGLPEKALQYERRAYDLNLELLDGVRIKAIANMESLYENKLKTAEINTLTAESKLAKANLNRHRLFLLIAGISAVLFVFIIIGLYRRMQHRKKLHEKEKLALE